MNRKTSILKVLCKKELWTRRYLQNCLKITKNVPLLDLLYDRIIKQTKLDTVVIPKWTAWGILPHKNWKGLWFSLFCGSQMDSQIVLGLDQASVCANSLWFFKPKRLPLLKVPKKLSESKAVSAFVVKSMVVKECISSKHLSFKLKWASSRTIILFRTLLDSLRWGNQKDWWPICAMLALLWGTDWLYVELRECWNCTKWVLNKHIQRTLGQL